MKPLFKDCYCHFLIQEIFLKNMAKKSLKKIFQQSKDVAFRCFPYSSSINQCEKCPYSELFWSKSSCIRTVRMRENADQNNSDYGHFLRSECLCWVRKLFHNAKESFSIIFSLDKVRRISYCFIFLFIFHRQQIYVYFTFNHQIIERLLKMQTPKGYEDF